jgi:hypothetical protein
VSLLFGHLILRLEEIIKQFQHFMSILGDLVVLLEVQQVVLGDCSRIFVVYTFQSLLVDFDNAFINAFVEIYLDEVSKKFYSKQILLISAFNQTTLELLQIIQTAFVLSTVVEGQSVVIKKFLPFCLGYDLFILTNQVSTEHFIQASCQKID